MATQSTNTTVEAERFSLHTPRRKTGSLGPLPLVRIVHLKQLYGIDLAHRLQDPSHEPLLTPRLLILPFITTIPRIHWFETPKLSTCRLTAAYIALRPELIRPIDIDWGRSDDSERAYALHGCAALPIRTQHGGSAKSENSSHSRPNRTTTLMQP